MLYSGYFHLEPLCLSLFCDYELRKSIICYKLFFKSLSVVTIFIFNAISLKLGFLLHYIKRHFKHVLEPHLVLSFIFQKANQSQRIQDQFSNIRQTPSINYSISFLLLEIFICTNNDSIIKIHPLFISLQYFFIPYCQHFFALPTLLFLYLNNLFYLQLPICV